MNKEELYKCIQKIKAGDHDAYEQLYQAYYPSMYRSAMKLCHNEADAKDALQMAFIQMYQNIDKLQYPEYFPYWFYRIVSNICKNMFRYNAHTVTMEDPYSKKQWKETIDQDMNNVMRKQSDCEVLMKLLKHLSKQHQEVLYLFYMKEQSHIEIAKQLNIPEGTVKSRLFAARKALQKEIEAYEAKEQVSLDFQMEVLGSVFAVSLLKKQMWFYPKKIRLKQSHMINNPIWLSIVVSSVIGIGLWGAYLQNRQETNHQKETEYASELSTIHFESVMTSNGTIDNAKDAYFYLKTMAYHKDMLRQRSQEQLQEMYPVVMQMQQHDTKYRDLLQKEDWFTTYFEMIEQ